jgi:AraC-like DNA-binding protein
MPIYMDRHDLKSVTAKDVAEAHREDLKIQHHYQCRGLTYWFDEKRGTAFCLIEAPNEVCVKRMHDDAHGLVPHQIIEVEPNVVNAFLGRIEDPHSSNFLDDTNQPIINETAYRIIMYISLKEIVVLRSIIESNTAIRMINNARDIFQTCMNRYKGREVIKDGKRLIISFTSAASAVMCALEIQNAVKSSSTGWPVSAFNIKISLTAGAPVTDQNGLFGETIQLAERLCKVANMEQVVISSEVRDAYNNEIIDGLAKEIPVQTLSPDDESFINNLVVVTESIWNDPQFDVGAFGKRLGLSRSQFYRKMSSITGLSPNDFIKEFRLQKALNLIENQKGNVAQVAFESGFNNPSYFSKCFRERYGILPSNLVSKIIN